MRRGVSHVKTTRKQALALIQAASAKGDTATATRLYIENRVGPAAYREAVAAGRRWGSFIAARDAGAIATMIQNEVLSPRDVIDLFVIHAGDIPDGLSGMPIEVLSARLAVNVGLEHIAKHVAARGAA
jgi:hypothetical protein